MDASVTNLSIVNCGLDVWGSTDRLHIFTLCAGWPKQGTAASEEEE